MEDLTKGTRSFRELPLVADQGEEENVRSIRRRPFNDFRKYMY